MGSKAEAVRKSGRVELNAISGARWFATTSLVMGEPAAHFLCPSTSLMCECHESDPYPCFCCQTSAHAIESLWLADGGECEWFRTDTCVWFKRISKDFVCFYLVLAGFTMTWGYMGRYSSWPPSLQCYTTPRASSPSHPHPFVWLHNRTLRLRHQQNYFDGPSLCTRPRRCSPSYHLNLCIVCS